MSESGATLETLLYKDHTLMRLPHASWRSFRSMFGATEKCECYNSFSGVNDPTQCGAGRPRYRGAAKHVTPKSSEVHGMETKLKYVLWRYREKVGCAPAEVENVMKSARALPGPDSCTARNRQLSSAVLGPDALNPVRRAQKHAHLLLYMISKNHRRRPTITAASNKTRQTKGLLA